MKAVLLFVLALVAVVGSAAAAAPRPAPAIGASRAAIPRPVKVARTTTIPACSTFVDAAFSGKSNGTVEKPHKTIAAAAGAAKSGEIICVAEGVYTEEIAPGTKPFTLAGGFQGGKLFKVRDSAKYVSKAKGDGGSFIRIEDPGPTGKQLTAIDGFEITGYAQAIYRDIYYGQRFDITNNYIHDNDCNDPALTGAGFALNNVTGTIRGNVFRRNVCGRGGAGSLNDSTNKNRVVIERNLVEANEGAEPTSSHGGGLYLFTNRLTIRGNAFTDNEVTGWGAGLFVGAFTAGGQHTTANLSWNLYRGNRAGIYGGGFFCDDGAKCVSDHDLFDSNCGGNVYVDTGPGGSGPTVAQFDHMTNYRARAAGCRGPGIGMQVDKGGGTAPDTYTVTNSIFWGNASKQDFAAFCAGGCNSVTVRVTYSMVNKQYQDGGIDIDFGAGILAPKDPRFVSAATGDFHLQSRFGHWTPASYITDAVSSPALAKGDPASPANQQPDRAGDRTELGTFGNSAQASYVR